MIHEEDVEAIERCTGGQQVPKAFVEEYAAWLRAYHCGFNYTGGLGAHMIPLLAKYSLLINPQEALVKPTETQWRDFDDDGSVSVEVDMFGAWQPGRFFGLVENGTLAVRMHDEDVTKEFHRSAVRLAKQMSPEMVELDEELILDTDPILIEWQNVPENTPVYIQTGKGTVPGKYIRISDKGNKLLCHPEGARNPLAYKAENVALVPQNQEA